MNIDAEALSLLLALPLDGKIPEDAKASHPNVSRLTSATALVAAALRGLVAEIRGQDRGVPIQELARYHAEPGDVIVAHVPGHLSEKDRAAILEQARVAFPGNRIVIVEGGIGIEVLNAAAAPAVGP